MSRRVAIAVAVGLAAGLIGALAPLSGVLDKLERQSVDARFHVRGAEPAPKTVAVVKIDDPSIQALGGFPFPRARYVAALRELKRAGARAIVVDVQFSEPSARGPADDRKLLQGISAARPVVLGTTTVKDGKPVLFAGARRLARAGATVGDADFAVPGDGVFRRVPHDVEGITHLSVAGVQAATGRTLDAKDFDAGGAWIDYRGHVPGLSLQDVRRGRFDPGLVRGKIVVLGATTPSLQDVHATSVDSATSGPEIHAQAIATLLDGMPLRDVPGWIGTLMAFAAGLIAPLASVTRRGGLALVAGIAGGLLGAAGLLGGAQLAFDGGHVVPLVSPLLALVAGSAGAIVHSATTEVRTRRRVRRAFERFVPPQVVGEVLAGAEDDRLPGEQLQATVMFCDLRGFTAWAEGVAPKRVIDTIDRYSQTMTAGVHAHGGTVITFLGDGLMAVFGAPLARDDHADRALAAARELSGPRLDAFNAGNEQPFRFGVGLNSGHVMSGTIGSGDRLEYVVVGDTTNVAARVQSLTKEAGRTILLTGATVDALRTRPPDLVDLGDLAVRGHQAVRAWSVDSGSSGNAGP